MKYLVLTLIILMLAFAAFAQTDFNAETAKWRADHEADISKETGWLTVAGLFWLKEGANTIGAGSGFDIELTDNFKGGKFGSISFSNGKATLKVEDGVEALVDDKPVRAIELLSDADGKPTTVVIGSQSFFIIKREDRFGVRVRDKNNVARREFSGLKWFDASTKYRVEAKFEAFPTPKVVLIPNVLGGNFKMKSPGVLKFRLNGKSFTLEPVLEEGSDKLFIIFRDTTSRKETYGAGRFLYANAPVDGKVILDFNRAENPPCAFTSFATCPLPPPQNRLNIAIRAGEKRYTNH